MMKRPWWIFFAAAGIAAVIGLMLGGGRRMKPGKSNVAGNTHVGPAGLDRTGANFELQPANPTDSGPENPGARESSRHAVGEVQKNLLQQERRKIETKAQLQSQLGSLLKYDDAQLVVYAAGLELPDNSVQVIYPKYLEAKRKLEDLKKNGGLGEVHPTVKAQKEKLDELKRELDVGLVNLRESLTAQLKLLEDRPPTAKD
jgi:hypothetical protein